jgi:sulfatase modifying factor 1
MDFLHAGGVPYNYRISAFEITEESVKQANVSGKLGITIDARGLHKPATSISWYEAARFVNWLNTSSGYSPAYKFNGDNMELWRCGLHANKSLP